MQSLTRTEHAANLMETTAEPLQQFLKRNGASRRQQPKRQRRKTQKYRPTVRRPLALLAILDDGSTEEGEIIRVRGDRVRIGRTRGDVTLPFDQGVSAEHAELRCEFSNGRPVWQLIDLASKNGTFVRCQSASLVNDTEMIIGGRHYLFHLPAPATQHNSVTDEGTRILADSSRSVLDQWTPRLEPLDERAGSSFPLQAMELRMGSHPSCEIAVDDDPFLSSVHARFFHGRSSCWRVEDLKSRNGLWVRIRRLAIDQTVEFQVGEQRFRFQPRVA